MPYEITSPAVIHCGVGAFDRIPGEAARLGTRAFIVTGGHLHGSARVNALLEDLRARGMQALAAEPVTGEPTVDLVDELAALVRQSEADVVVAIGGGSVMDAAKAAAAIAPHEGATEDYQLRRREITYPPIAQVMAPTTAGTGSEATRVSVLTNAALGVKRSISHPLMTPDSVVLDPELTASCSRYLTTITAMDAFAHAIESAVSRGASAYTRHIALAGVEHLSRGLPRAQKHPDDLDARLMCLTGSCFAGLAMQQGLGASHSIAPAVCIVAGIRHSEAVGALLPHAIRLNERFAPGTYDEVKRAMRCEGPATCLEGWSESGEFTASLAAFGLKLSDWEQVREVMERYASHRATNPVEVTDAYAAELFAASVRG